MRRLERPGHPPPDGLYASEHEEVLIPMRDASAQMCAALAAWMAQHENEDMPAKDVRARFFGRLDKQRVREILRAEQHGRCAFCEGLVTAAPPGPDDRSSTGIRIAHWTPIEVDRAKARTWANLFGSCQRQGTDAHCDVYQENNAPPRSAPTPAEQDYGLCMQLSADGSLRPRDALTPEAKAHVAELIALFNLNAGRLKAARCSAIDGLRKRLDRRRAAGIHRPYNAAEIYTELTRLRGVCPSVPYPTAQRLWLEERHTRG
jgi:uncharacterized protein (TIGR02646 family)